MALAQLLVLILWWMALATWFGGVLFVAVSAPIIFRTIRENEPVLPTVLSVNLEGQHGTLLAGSIVTNILAALAKLELVCAAVMLVTLISQWVMWPDKWAQHLIRSALFVAAVVLLLYKRYRIEPQVVRHRKQYIENADTPEVANPAKEQFDRFHQESVTVLMILLALLVGMILFSASLAEPRSWSPLRGSPTSPAAPA
jgi:hypothetical protein